jgi:hypothetical protein
MQLRVKPIVLVEEGCATLVIIPEPRKHRAGDLDAWKRSGVKRKDTRRVSTSNGF